MQPSKIQAFCLLKQSMCEITHKSFQARRQWISDIQKPDKMYSEALATTIVKGCQNEDNIELTRRPEGTAALQRL